MHFYPHITKEAILDMTHSYVQTLLQMVGYIIHPEKLEELKPVKFASEFEFEQYILNKWI